MNPESFAKNFHILANAPNGIQKLREMILQLAVMGKLVPQNPEDEPASVLLKEIMAEKENLIKEGKINKTKPLPPIQSEKVPYELQEGWDWVRLREIGYTQTGTTPRKGDIDSYGTDVPFIKPADIYENNVDYENEGLSWQGVKKYGRLASAGSCLMVCIGTIGKTNLIDRPCSFNQQINSITPVHTTDHQMIKWILRSPYFQSEAWGRSSSTTISILNKRKWESIPIPFPPLAEQKRIVAKVNQFMVLCNELEARQQMHAQKRITLNSACLKALSLVDKDSIQNAWKRINNNFDLLYDCPENVTALRQAIFQLAVQGKLVLQDPNDEPASVLLKKIKAEKEKLIKEGKIRKQKPLLPMQPNEIHYDLPESWKWVRIWDVTSLKSGMTLPKDAECESGDLPYLKVADLNLPGNERTITASSRYFRLTPAIRNFVIPPNSIIFPKRGGAIATNKKRLVHQEILVDINTMAMICILPLSLDYLYVWFLSVDLWKLYSGTSVPQINNKDVGPLLFPLPPLAEQKRIVAKVDQLMALCDELEAKLKNSQSVAETLMRAVVNELAAV